MQVNSSHEPAKRELAEAVAESWNRAAIDYAVLHGLESYPQRLGRDLDVCVAARQMKPCADAVVETAQRLGFKVLVHHTTWGHDYLFVFSGAQRRIVLEIDLLPGLQWGPSMLLPAPDPRETRGPFKVDPWAGFVKRILIQILAGNFSKLRKKPEELGLSAGETAVVPARVAELFGSGRGATLIDGLQRRDLQLLERVAPDLRRGLVLRSFLHHPLRAAAAAWSWAAGELTHLFPRRCAPIVALVGNDEARIEKLAHLAQRPISRDLPFPDILIRKLRPGLLPLPGTHGATKRGDPPGVLGVLRLAGYYADYLIGGWLEDRKASSRLQCVLYHDCALSLGVDPLRYGLASAAGTRFVWRFSPRPELVIWLDDRGAGEGAPREMEQNRKWAALADAGSIDAVVDASAAPDQVAERIGALVTDAFLGRSE